MGEGGHHYGGVGQATEEGIHSPFKSIHNCLQQIQQALRLQGTGEVWWAPSRKEQLGALG